MKTRFVLSAFLLALPLYLHAQNKTTGYTYDALGRLTFVSDSVNGNRDYDYDKAGNRVNVVANTGTDGASESIPKPLAAPTGLSYGTHWGKGYDTFWTSVSGATYYKLTFGTQIIYRVDGGSSNKFSTGADTLADRPNYIVACNTAICSAPAYFSGSTPTSSVPASSAPASSVATSSAPAKPVPTNLDYSLIYSCAWQATWDSISGVSTYRVVDTSGGSQYVSKNVAVIQCPVGNSSGNKPQSVQACDSSNVCGSKVYFNQ